MESLKETYADFAEDTICVNILVGLGLIGLADLVSLWYLDFTWNVAIIVILVFYVLVSCP